MPELEYALPDHAGELRRLRARAAGLLVTCPLSQDNPFDCPLRSVRLRPMRERYRWLDSLAPAQLSGLIAQHTDCLLRKENERHEPA
ncbi:MAG TPA: hypothetical protein VL200_00345 [Lacunisphaera sp.]|nr:hypothetical protein [Lacunisphaera sp.]